MLPPQNHEKDEDRTEVVQLTSAFESTCNKVEKRLGRGETAKRIWTAYSAVRMVSIYSNLLPEGGLLLVPSRSTFILLFPCYRKERHGSGSGGFYTLHCLSNYSLSASIDYLYAFSMNFPEAQPRTN